MPTVAETSAARKPRDGRFSGWNSPRAFGSNCLRKYGKDAALNKPGRVRANKLRLRVVFDTNAFQPGTFEILQTTNFVDLCRIGRIEPVYGHVFFEETLRAYGVAGKRDDLVNRWLPFIMRTAAGRLCDDFISIWHSELVEGRGRHARIYLPRKIVERIESEIPRIPLDGSWRAWHAST